MNKKLLTATKKSTGMSLAQYAALLEKTCQLTRQAHDESLVADALIFLPPTPGAHAAFYDEMTSRGMRLDMVGYRYYWV